MSDVVYEACVVGLGAVGCAVARQVCLGHSCIAIEKNLDPLDEASGGNTGHLATNFYFDVSALGQTVALQSSGESAG